MPVSLALFAKAPIPGRVKTRLQPHLSPQACATLHEAFVLDTWERMSVLDGLEAFLYCDQPWEPFEDLAGASRLRFQRGGDLGARMLNCTRELYAERQEPVIVVGTDSPTVPLDYVRCASSLLAECEAVLGPSEDGGYYLVGVQKPHPEMFRGAGWSTAKTLAETEAAFTAVGWRIEMLPEWYDVDRIGDLQRLAREATLPPRVARWFGTHPDHRAHTGDSREVQ